MATKPRSIFVEVATTERPVAAAGAIDRGKPDARRWVRLWLLALLALVVAMILVGGLTRLTESGLSITRWDLVTGSLPPLSDAAWQEEFARYQATPQYQAINQGMGLDAFKTIYWWEWSHRLLGRVIGGVWIVGFLGLLAARRIPRGWAGPLLVVGVLIGLQGAVGWWMVSSGLAPGMVSVASTRLAVHLGLAFAILGLLWRDALLLGRREAELMNARRLGDARLVRAGSILVGMVFVQVLLGALVAGIDAGKAFPTWPLMGDSILPPDPFAHDPWWSAFVVDAGLVQFLHRTWGYLLALAALLAWVVARRSPHPSLRSAFGWVLGVVVAQIALGVGTVLSGVEIGAASAHQAGAILLFLLAVRARVLSRAPVAVPIRGT